MSMVPVPGGPGMPPQVMGPQPGNPQSQPGMNAYMPNQNQDKLDNISKVKSLIGQLRESLTITLKSAAHTLHQNSLVDSGVGSSKGVDVPTPRFDKSLEEFNSICDQIELHLKTSIECVNQSSRSQRYLSVGVAPNRNELSAADINSLTYPQYLATVRAQVSYAKEVHDLLLNAAQNITPSD